MRGIRQHVALVVAAVMLPSALGAIASRADAESGTPTNWAVAPNSGPGWLAGVSCSGPHRCVAVGATGDPEASSRLVELWNGSTRRVQSIAHAGRSSRLWGVSCVSAVACVAVGGTTEINEYPLAERWDGSRWREQILPFLNKNADLYGVSCVAADDCMAVGSSWYAISSAVAVHWDGHEWLPTPRPPLLPDWQSSFTAVSCPRRNFCIATGTATPPNRASTVVIALWDGRQWSLVWSTPAVGGSQVLSGVSCSDPAHCVAVGWRSNPKTGAATPFVVQWNGSGWRTVVNPIFSRVLSRARLTGVSCANPMRCVVVGTATNAANTAARPLLASWDGARWTPALRPPESRSSYDALNAVSCSDTHCAAVGQFHDAGTHTLGWSGIIPRRAVNVSWTAAEAAGLRELARELRLQPAAVQKTAVYALAYVVGGASGPATHVSPTSGRRVATYTTVWDPSEFTVIDSVRARFGVDSVDATRVAVHLLSYLHALRGQ